MSDPTEILAGLARAKALFQGRAVAAAMGDTLTSGTGAIRLTVDGVEHIAPAELRPNRCYGCNRVEAPAGWVGSYYCGGCAEWDAYTSDPGDDAEPEE